MTFPYFGGPDEDDDERPMSAGMGETRAVTTKSHQTEKRQEKTVTGGLKKKEEEEEADVRNSFPELCNKVDSESSRSQLASSLLIPSTCVQYISPRLCCAAAPGGRLRFPSSDAFASLQVVTITSALSFSFSQSTSLTEH